MGRKSMYNYHRHSFGLSVVLFLSIFSASSHAKTKYEILGKFHRPTILSEGAGGADTSSATTLVEDNEVNYDLGDASGNGLLAQKGLKESDKIEKLPGQPVPVNFDQYGGYVTVDKKAGKAFYYYFAEADRGVKDSLPLLLWLNGGPGCSSLAYGAMQELGPFRVLSDGKTLFKNIYAWNKAANVLFLESPVGVGFSYSNTSSDYATNGDGKTAALNYAFLVNWLDRFPEYKNRDFFISGESYAGHYVPQLAHYILTQNKKAKKTIVNLKGIIIGNACINEEADTKGNYDYFATHALNSYETVDQIQKTCDFSGKTSDANQTKECKDALEKSDAEFGNVNIYSIYAPLCFSSNVTAKPKRVSIMEFDPCSDNYVYAYLNSHDVQAALHANVTRLPYDWQPCSDVMRGYGDRAFTIIPLLQEFTANGIRVWVFSGDTDGRVPVTSTIYSLNMMNMTVKTQWHPWYLDGEVGGYTQVFQGDLTFATVRNAGHQVPSYQPKRALSLISHFLHGTALPDQKPKKP